MVTIQNYVRVRSLEEAYQLNQNRKNKILGGMLWLRLGHGSIGTAIDISDLGLDKIEESDEEFFIGAMTTLRDLELHTGLNAYTNGAVGAAVRDIVGVQFRNMATVGGSIWGRFGFSDVLTVFLALDTYVELYHGGVVTLEEFSNMPHDNDILVRLIVKKTPIKVAYLTMRNQRTDFPVLACAVSCINGESRAVIGARPAKAVIVRDEAAYLQDGITDAGAKAFAEYTAKQIRTGSNVRGSAEYRTHLVRVLTERAAKKLGGL